METKNQQRPSLLTALYVSDLAHDDVADFLQKAKIKVLMRQSFYADLNRRPPTDVKHMPSYVRAVKKKWSLLYNNSARSLLAQVEGFKSWAEMMAHNALPAHNALSCKELTPCRSLGENQ